jgi:multiple sugar transport system ATP-binding protein
MAGEGTTGAVSQISFEGVTKRFGEVVAVDELSLEIDDGEFMVLLGPSGCGKTTVLRMIAGLDAATSGQIRIGERVVNDVEAKDRDVSMVFQSYALYPHLSVFKNIESPMVARRVRVDGALRRLDRDERSERVRRAASTLGLSELLDRKPAALSGGQRQRVALARAIVSRPTAFLMDEPLSNLDAKLRAQTRLELAELHRRLATTTVYVTHDQVEAMTMATRLAILDAGRLQQVGTPRQIYEQPVNLFVARFVGSPPMNTLPATVRIADGRLAVSVGDGTWDVEASTGRLEDGAPVVAGVRPEQLEVGSGGVPATVRAVEWLGNEAHVMADVGGELVVARAPADVPELPAGSPIGLRAAPGAVHLFDPGTGRRLT